MHVATSKGRVNEPRLLSINSFEFQEKISVLVTDYVFTW